MGWARATENNPTKGSPRGCEGSKEPELSQGHVNVKPGKTYDSSISHQKEKNQFCIKSSLFKLIVKQKKLITSLHIVKGLFYPVDFGRSGHWELLNETTAGEKKLGQKHEKKKKGRQEAENDTFCEWSGKQEKRNHSMVREVKRRDQ